MQKKKIAVSLLVAGAFIGGMKIDDISKEKENLAYAEIEKVETKNVSHERNQDDIYATNKDEDLIMQLPLKAKKDSLNGFDYFILSDGQGSFYVTMDYLEDGTNYIGFIDKETDELMEYIESDFVFDYESDWEKESYLMMDREVGRRLMKERFNGYISNF